MKLISTACALGLIALGGRGFSEEGHTHNAPHGGQVKTVGKYHVEALISDGSFFAYLLDEKENTLKPPDRARVTLQIGKGKHDLELKAVGDHLMASLTDEAKRMLYEGKGKSIAVATIAIDGKPQSMRFSFRSKVDRHEHPH